MTFLPEPERQPRKYTFISVDDHIVEPPDIFEGRLPRALQDRAPRVVEEADGRQHWSFEGKQYPNIGFNAVVGRPVMEASFEPTRFDEMRRGAWDIDARIADMDIDGVYASVNFPSALLGFAGQRLQRETDDPALALALIRANNDWHKEVWADAYPDRIIPCQVPYLLDPEVGAAEIRSNAARGFKAVTFPEAPEKLGLPSLHTGYWDPVMRGLRGDGDGHLPAYRLLLEPAVHLLRRAGGRHRRARVRLRDVLCGRLALLDDSGALPRHQDRHVRRRDRLGAGPAGSARPRAEIPRHLRHLAGPAADPGRGVPTQLLALRAR